MTSEYDNEAAMQDDPDDTTSTTREGSTAGLARSQSFPSSESASAPMPPLNQVSHAIEKVSGSVLQLKLEIVTYQSSTSCARLSELSALVRNGEQHGFVSPKHGRRRMTVLPRLVVSAVERVRSCIRFSHMSRTP